MTAPTPSPVTDEMVERAAKACRHITFDALTMDECRDAARACLAAALDGMVVVPREPNIERMETAGKAVDGYIKKMADAGGEVDATDYALRAVIYRAMITAATPQAQGE